MTRRHAASRTGRRSGHLLEAQAHARYEELLAKVITAADPLDALRAATQKADLPPRLRRALRQVDEDGLRMAALLVARLRFERLMRGSTDAEAWFERDPGEFTAAFQQYHQAVPPTAFFPSGEARLFREWLAHLP
ncbi:hypothetical protein [Chondromyces crocatus]|uniref:Uncharacterized protein n=1 Tax=Chondromyces crocatus TaxID=52 RepID=A0A0K1E7N6_CHOCO|nr:hypothetical protein [Chondromyces crocatus]AKT36692.1 uncharacterized protein CMC5_008130 [Chondromyces crocatus]